MLDFNEKLAEKIGNRISIENKSETKEMTKIISENKLKTLFELDKEKPPKRQPRPFNPEKKSNSQIMFIEKDKDKMSYEDKVMVLDKCASINPGVAYKYRFNIIQENQLRLIGDDIIFSVPKIKSIKLPEIADINNKKTARFRRGCLNQHKNKQNPCRR